jgi:hypothetical protein
LSAENRRLASLPQQALEEVALAATAAIFPVGAGAARRQYPDIGERRDEPQTEKRPADLSILIACTTWRFIYTACAVLFRSGGVGPACWGSPQQRRSSWPDRKSTRIAAYGTFSKAC